jgi:hypothetical protein
MQMPQLATTEAEFNAAEAMVMSRYPLPTLNGPTHRFDCCVFCHYRRLRFCDNSDFVPLSREVGNCAACIVPVDAACGP